MAKAQEIQSVRSLSIAAIGGKPKSCVNTGKPAYMGRVFGEITDIKYKEDRNGRQQAQFVGSFRGVGTDGTVYESERLYLPGTISEGLEGLQKTSGGAPVKFAFDIIAQESEKSPVGYAYATKALIKTEASDRLTELAAEMDTIAMPTAKGKAAAAKE